MTAVDISYISTGVVSLGITPTTTITGIVRADVNGTRPLRTTGVFPRVGTTPFTLRDYEAAFHGLVEYRISSAGSTIVRRIYLDQASKLPPRFSLPLVPYHSVSVTNVIEYEEEQETTSTIHQVIDSPDPLVVIGRMSSRRGTFKSVMQSYAETSPLRDLVGQGTVILFRQSENPGQDLYFVATSYRVVADPDTDTWAVSIGYVEVLHPAGDYRNLAGWTFAALAAQEASFAVTAENYDTFKALHIKDQS